MSFIRPMKRKCSLQLNIKEMDTLGLATYTGQALRIALKDLGFKQGEYKIEIIKGEKRRDPRKD